MLSSYSKLTYIAYYKDTHIYKYIYEIYIITYIIIYMITYIWIYIMYNICV